VRHPASIISHVTPAKEEGISLGDVSTARRCTSECQWLKPVLVGQFEFLEWTGENHLRHSKFVGLREDTKATDVVRE
jgi:ATP-dependent DNA ligase